MKRKTIEVLFIVIGILLIAYPVVSNLVSAYHKTVAISNYQTEIENVDEEIINQKLEEAKKYNEEFETQTSVDLSLHDEGEKNISQNYYSLLDLGEVMAYVSIPKINVYLPIYHGLSDDVLQIGIGHMESTALPVGGLGTHAVLAGHTGLAKAKMFDDINKLKLGDKFYIHVLDEVLEYEVNNIKVVEPQDTNAIVVDKQKDYVTLVTCTPYMLNTHRLLVRGERIPFDGNEFNENIDNDNSNELVKENKVVLKENTEKIINKKRIDIIISIIIFIVLSIILLAFVLIDPTYKKEKKKSELLTKTKKDKRKNRRFKKNKNKKISRIE